MQLEARKYLYDMRQAAERLARFSRDKSFAEYESDVLLRSAVERQFEIIGEALSQLARIDSDTAARISEHRRIIAFRNILIHGYADVDNRLVWGVLESKLPLLQQEVDTLLAEGGA